MRTRLCVLGLVLAHGAVARAEVRVHVDKLAVTIAGVHATVSGTYASERGPVDLVVRAEHAILGTLALHDVVARVRDRGAALGACVAGDLGDARVTLCGTVPRALDRLGSLHAIDVDVAIATHDAHATARGTARLAWIGAGAVRIERAHFDVATRAWHDGPVAIGTGRASIDVAGSLAPLALELTGGADVATASVGGAVFRALHVPVALRATIGETGVRLAPRGEIVARAGSATAHVGKTALAIIDPVVALHDATPFVPFAPGALIGVPHAIRWSRITGLPIAVGPGSIELADGGIAGAHLSALGADLTVTPEAHSIVVRARGLDLGRVLAAAGRGRVTGSGLLDGTLVFELGAGGPALASGDLHARGPGRIAIVPLAGMAAGGFALHRRILATLADFAYDRLAMEFGRGDVDARVAIAGHGARVPQVLDLVFNLRGVRSLARRLVTRATRKDSP